MPDHQMITPADAFVLDPPVGVPEPAPLEMPRSRIRRFPVDLARLLPKLPAVARNPRSPEVV